VTTDADHVRDTTQWSDLPIETVTVAQLSKTFPAFYGNTRSTTITARHRSTSSARQLQSTQSVHSYLSYSLILCQSHPDGLFPAGLPTTPVYELPFPLMQATQLNFE
jgi:hypothetical protein